MFFKCICRIDKMLVQFVFTAFAAIIFTAVLLEVVTRYITKKSNTNPQFLAFQRLYFLAYYPVLFGDWLNAPYLYKLYNSYGFMEEQIAIIYVCGFASAVVFGITSSYAVQKFGRCRTFVFATFAYAITCLMKLSSSYSVLILSRIISGAATSLLFTAQEMWYMSEHLQTHDFPPEWINYTLIHSSKGNGIIAIVAGVIAYLMSEVYGFGPVAPSVLSVVFLLGSCLIVVTKWKEGAKESTDHPRLVVRSNSTINKAGGSSSKKKFFKECGEGLRKIAQNSDLLQVGIIQALFESVLCLFVFLWTPVLDHHNPPLGIVFSSLMAATLVGGALYRISKSIFKNLYPAYSLLFILLSAGAAVLACVLSTHPSREFPVVSFTAFLMFEVMSGVYFPVMVDLKHKIELDKLDLAVTTWFRVPLNLLACAGLIFLHSSSNANGTRNLFACCVVIIAFAVAFSLKFTKSSRGHKIQSTETEELLT